MGWLEWSELGGDPRVPELHTSLCGHQLLVACSNDSSAAAQDTWVVGDYVPGDYVPSINLNKDASRALREPKVFNSTGPRNCEPLYPAPSAWAGVDGARRKCEWGSALSFSEQYTVPA